MNEIINSIVYKFVSNKDKKKVKINSIKQLKNIIENAAT